MELVLITLAFSVVAVIGQLGDAVSRNLRSATGA